MGISLYFYRPSLGASIVFTILYTLPFLYHFRMSIIAPRTGKYSKTGYFIPVVFGAAIEVAAYGVRTASVKKPDNIGLYAVSASLIVIAPVLLCASLYILIGRLINFRSGIEDPSFNSSEKQPVLFASKVSAKWIPRIFLMSDVLSFLTQASGSGIASSNEWKGTTKDVGIGVLIGGLVLQLVTFALFLALVVWYHVRILSSSTKKDSISGVQSVLKGIYIAGSFIMVRLIYRVVEFSIGIGGYTWTHEWPLYVLEAVPMFIAMIAVGWYHPARWLSSVSRGIPTELRSH